MNSGALVHTVGIGMKAATAAMALVLGTAQPQLMPILVSLNVTVTDAASHYVTDLQPADFSVVEGGVRQDVTSVVLGQRMAIALIVDTSASMQSRLAVAQQAAALFARRLRSEDLAELIAFADRPVVLQGLTNDAGAIERAIRGTSARGPTSLYDAIALALTDLQKTAESSPEFRRPAIVVLSDGADTSSVLRLDDVLDRARRSNTAIYAIALKSANSSATGEASVFIRSGSREGALVMRQFAQETGGRAFIPNHVSDLTGVYNQVFDELSSQYTVGYTSKNSKRDGKRRRIAVKVNRPSLTIRTRQAYFAPTSLT